MAKSVAEEPTPRQTKFIDLFADLIKKSYEFAKERGFSREAIDPEDTFLLKGVARPPVQYGPLTYRLAELFRANKDMWNVREAVLSLQQISRSLPRRRNASMEYAARIRALEYAIWDAQYRFYEHLRQVVNTAKKLSSRPDIDDVASIYIKSLRRAFQGTLKTRGINTHEYQIDVDGIEDIASLGLLSDYGFKDDENSAVRNILNLDIIIKTNEHRKKKKDEEERFRRTSAKLMEFCMEFVFEYCDVERLFEDASNEEIRVVE